MSRKTPPCGRAAAFLDLGVDGARDVVARRQLRRPAMVGLAALRQGVHPGPRLLVRGGVLVAAVLRQVAPHEALAVGVAQDAALAAHGLGDEQAAHAGRMDHAGRVELHELHVDELGAGPPGQRVAVAGGLPGVGGDGEGAARAAGGEDDGPGREGHRDAVRAPVADGADDAGRAHGQPRDDGLLVDLDADGHAAVLQRPDELQAGAVADVGEARVGVAAEGPLQDAPVPRAVEDGAPGLQLAHAVRCLPGVQLRHARVVEQPAADHRVAEVRGPRVAVVHVARGRRPCRPRP